jgi:hypothetical protein
MDWPVVGAVTGVTASAAVLAVTAYALIGQDNSATSAVRTPLLMTEHSMPARTSPQPRVGANSFNLASAPANGPAGPARPSFHVDPYETGNKAALSYGSPQPAPYQIEQEKTFGPASEAPAPKAAKHHKAHPVPEARKHAPEHEREHEHEHEHEAAKAHEPKAHAEQPRPQHVEPPRVDHRLDGVLTASEIVRIRNALRLTAEQKPHWPAVEVQLRIIGHQQMKQINSGQKPEVSTSAVQSLYMAAQPLLAILSEQQKEVVRRLARSVGYASVASMI